MKQADGGIYKPSQFRSVRETDLSRVKMKCAILLCSLSYSLLSGRWLQSSCERLESGSNDHNKKLLVQKLLRFEIKKKNLPVVSIFDSFLSYQKEITLKELKTRKASIIEDLRWLNFQRRIQFAREKYKHQTYSHRLQQMN